MVIPSFGLHSLLFGKRKNTLNTLRVRVIRVTFVAYI
jgi:hypothetical protein